MEKTHWNTQQYDTEHEFVSQYGKSLLPLLDAKKGERILDLGCGTGTLTHEIAQTGAEVIGIDHSPQMIEAASTKYPDIHFQIADGQDFHFDIPFDAVFSNAALHWMLAPEKVIDCVWNALKSNGRFVFEMGGEGNLNHLLKYIDIAAQEFNIMHFPLTNYYPSLEDYATLLKNRGFHIEHAEIFKRPTKLPGEVGLRHWVQDFRSTLLEQIPIAEHEAFFQKLEDLARPELYHDNAWWADYVRLWMVARKL